MPTTQTATATSTATLDHDGHRDGQQLDDHGAAADPAAYAAAGPATDAPAVPAAVAASSATAPLAPQPIAGATTKSTAQGPSRLGAPQLPSIARLSGLRAFPLCHRTPV